MLFKKTFSQRVWKTDKSAIIAVGDTAKLILKDNVVKTVTVTTVERGGRRLGWQLTTDGIPRSEDVLAIHGDHQKDYAAYLTQGYDETDPDNAPDPITGPN